MKAIKASDLYMMAEYKPQLSDKISSVPTEETKKEEKKKENEWINKYTKLWKRERDECEKLRKESSVRHLATGIANKL